MRMKNAIDTVLEKVISRKLMAWLVTILLLVLFAVFQWDVPDRLIDVFKVVTVTYISTQGAVDFAKALREGPGIMTTIRNRIGGQDPDSEIIDEP